MVVQVSENNFRLVGKTEDVVFTHLGECKGIQYYIVECKKVQYPIRIRPLKRYIEFTYVVMYNDVRDVPKYLLANYLQIEESL